MAILLELTEVYLRFFVRSEIGSSISGRIIVPWRAETKTVLKRLKITIEAGPLGLKLQSFLLHPLFLVRILMTSKRLWVGEFLETILALEFLVVGLYRRAFLLGCTRNGVGWIHTFITFTTNFHGVAIAVGWVELKPEESKLFLDRESSLGITIFAIPCIFFHLSWNWGKYWCIYEPMTMNCWFVYLYIVTLQSLRFPTIQSILKWNSFIIIMNSTNVKMGQ